MNKTLKPCCIAFLITLSAIFTHNHQLHCMQEKPLIAGICVNGLPYAEINQIHALFVGFDIDLACALAQELDRQIIFSNQPYPSLLSDLQKGNIDILGFSYNICPERLQQMDMIDVYSQTKGIGFGVKKGSFYFGKLERAIEKMKKNGTIDKLKKEWSLQ